MLFLVIANIKKKGLSEKMTESQQKEMETKTAVTPSGSPDEGKKIKCSRRRRKRNWTETSKWSIFEGYWDGDWHQWWRAVKSNWGHYFWKYDAHHVRRVRAIVCWVFLKKKGTDYFFIVICWFLDLRENDFFNWFLWLFNGKCCTLCQ